MAGRPPYARRRATALGLLVLVAAVPLALTRGHGDAGRAAGQRTAARAARALAIGRAIGQTLAGSYAGARPSASFVRRVRAGRLGAVILFGANTTGGVRATRAAVDRLQAAARAGGNPPLLVMTDQEGGGVARLPGPPDRAPARMTSVAVARGQGAATGRLLRRAGVTMDLAPVADVTRRARSFLGDRSFGSDPTAVALRACAFADGLRSAGVVATLKHFPGLGRGPRNTDSGPVTIPDDAARIRGDWEPYRRCASAKRTAVMLSSATYPALLGRDAPAVLSPAAYARALPAAGVPAATPTISDDLDAGAVRGRAHVAARALRAGLDLLLFARTEGSSARAYRALVREVRAGSVPVARVRDAARAVLALKAPAG